MVPILKLEDKAQTLNIRKLQRMVTVWGFTEILAAQYLMEKTECYVTSRGKKTNTHPKQQKPATQHFTLYFYSFSNSTSCKDHSIPEAHKLCLLLVLAY